MIVHLLLSFTTPSSFTHVESFSPSLPDIVVAMQWRYGDNCTGLEAYWETTLPPKSLVQVMAGPKTQKKHFDDDAIIQSHITINADGQAYLPLGKEQFNTAPTFLNIRVWGNTPQTYEKLKESQKNGGFPIAESPQGPYGWAESTIPSCIN